MVRKYVRPPWLAREIGNRISALTGTPMLVVRGRRTGEPRSVTVNVLELDGDRYLVAPRGETDWVRNLRAAGEALLRMRGVSEQIHAEEITGDPTRFVEAYKEHWGGGTRGQWEALPDPSDHPVFRITPV